MTDCVCRCEWAAAAPVVVAAVAAAGGARGGRSLGRLAFRRCVAFFSSCRASMLLRRPRRSLRCCHAASTPTGEVVGFLSLVACFAQRRRPFERLTASRCATSARAARSAGRVARCAVADDALVCQQTPLARRQAALFEQYIIATGRSALLLRCLCHDCRRRHRRRRSARARTRRCGLRRWRRNVRRRSAPSRTAARDCRPLVVARCAAIAANRTCRTAARWRARRQT